MKETKFKYTEIGYIPNDWEVKNIDEICSITTGSQNTQDHNDNGKYPFFVRSQEIEKIDKYIFDTEGVITAGDGVGTGKIFHYVNGKFGLHQRCYLMYNFNENIHPKFFYWVFSNNFYERVHSMTAKSSVDSVRREMIAGMQIPMPPKSEQTRIATVLSKVDALISELGRLIEKKRAIKQGAMQQLLTGKKRLKGFSEPWVEKKLGEIGSFRKGRGISRSDAASGNLPAIRYGEIYTCHNNYIVTFHSFISEEIAVSSTPISYGDILFAASGETKEDIGKSVAYIGNKEAYAGGDIIILHLDTESYNPKYCGYALNARYINEQKSQRGQGDAVVHIVSRDLCSILFYCPKDIKEQSAIASVLSSMDEEISALEAKKAKYEQIKQGMMQQLLTGKIRLTE